MKKKKYIDAEKLKAEIEKNTPDRLQLLVYRDIILSLIDSLQQEQPEALKIWLTKQFNLAQKCMKSAERDWERAYRNGQMEAYGKVLLFIGGSPDEPSKQVQPEEGLEQEMVAYIEKHFHIRYDETLEVGNDPLTTADFDEIARHFAEWGATHLNARKEE